MTDKDNFFCEKVWVGADGWKKKAVIRELRKERAHMQEGVDSPASR